MERLTGWIWGDDDCMRWSSVAIILLACVPPPLIGALLMGRAGAIAFIASFAAHLAARDSGIRIAALITLTIGMAGFFVMGDPLMAILVAPVLGLMTGICGHFGFARPAIHALIPWTVFTAPIIETETPHLSFAVYLAAMGWSLAITHWFDEKATGDAEDRESDEYALTFGIILAIGLGISVWVGHAFFGPHGFWFPLTFAVLVLPPHGSLFSRTRKRTVGTVLGTAIALGIAWMSGDTWVTLAVGLAALPLAFRFLPANYTVFTAFLTIAILEVLALVSEMGSLASERLWTMAAAAILTGILGALAYGVLKVWRPEALRVLQDE